jgi:endoglucanase
VLTAIIAAMLVAAAPGDGNDRLRASDPLAPLRSAARSVLGWWRTQRRTAAAIHEPAFGRVAVSQVGYAPSMRKLFTSPRAFRAFRVLRDPEGTSAFEGSGPIRQLDSDLLGAVRTVWIGDFSELRTPGRYRIVIDGELSSHPFDVGPGVFDPATRAVQRSFYFQRAFTAIEARHAEGPWVHPSDADRAPPGIAKGWHDAGDFTVYDGSVNVAVFWMLESFEDFRPMDDDTNIPESGNGIPDILDEARWGLEWLLSTQAPSGGFSNTTCQDRYGPYGTNTPNSVPPYRQGEVGTMATARATGTLAYASTVFRRFDPAFARRCLDAALAGHAFLAARPDEHSDGPTCPANRHDADPVAGRHVRMYAAAGLLLATDEDRYRDEFELHHVEITRLPGGSHMNGYAARLYLRAARGNPSRVEALRARLREMSDRAIADGSIHPFQSGTEYHWGSVGDAFNRAAAFNVPSCLEDRGRPAACDQALANLHYALGRNLLQFSFIGGLPGVSRGMSWSFHHWLKTLDASPHNFPGLVAAGPNRSPEPADGSFPAAWPVAAWGYWGDPAMPRDASTPVDGRYTDNDSWSTNEPDVVWQGVALYLLHFARWMAWASWSG